MSLASALIDDVSKAMSAAEFRQLRDLISAHAGIHLPDGHHFLLARRLVSRLPLFGAASFREYYRVLKYSPEGELELQEVIDRVATNETYFFREARGLNTLIEDVLPQLRADTRRKGPIRIWSAGCATGEEPYSIAMLAHIRRGTNASDLEIFGNDISRKALRAARRGVYRESAFRETDTNLRRRFFSCEGDASRLNDEIRRRVHFAHVNLLDPVALATIAPVDVIMCRNVMIYFEADVRRRLVETFADKLRPGGYLFLGHAESLLNLSTAFELLPMKKDLVYRKPSVR